jgi:large subunit ribosomal protein L17
MRHRRGCKKLSKPTDQRLALLRNLVISLITYGKLETTEQRAKEAVKLVEKIITLGKEKNVASIRNALKIIPHKPTINKIFKDLGQRFAERKGGYVRILRTRLRRGDAAQMVLMEFVDKGENNTAAA